MMNRLVLESDASEKQLGNKSIGFTVVKEYLSQTPNLHIATATINGSYPPEEGKAWAINEEVEEMFYVLEGEAEIIYQDGKKIKLEPNSVAYIPKNLKYCVNKACYLRVIIITTPAWFSDQHKWLSN